MALKQAVHDSKLYKCSFCSSHYFFLSYL